MANQRAIEAILNLLEGRSYLPSELISALTAEGYVESDVREAVLQLLHDEVLELTTNRHLTLHHEALAV